MAMSSVVTTCPRPRSLSTPNTDIGATGWMMMIPYRIKSHSVSVRRNRGAALLATVASVLKVRPTDSTESFQSAAILREPSPSRKTKLPAPLLRHHGDLGAGAKEILRANPVRPSLGFPEIAAVYDSLAKQRGPAAKQALLEHTLQRLSALEAKYFIKIATGELRIGLKESLVEEAIAQAFDRPLPSVQRANMLIGDISETLRLAVP